MSAGDAYWDGYLAQTDDLPPREMYAWFLDRWQAEEGTLLDLGAGTGRFAQAFVKERPRLSVDAMDGSPNALAYLQARQGVRRAWIAAFEEASFATRAYDAVWAMNVLFFLDGAALAALLRRLRDALKPHGLLACTFLEEDDAYPPFLSLVRVRFTEEALTHLLRECGFRILLLERRLGTYGDARVDQPFFRVLAERV